MAGPKPRFDWLIINLGLFLPRFGVSRYICRNFNEIKKTIIAHKNKPINRIFSATTLKVGAKESPDVGASIGGHGFGWQGLEKFLEPFTVIYFKKK